MSAKDTINGLTKARLRELMSYDPRKGELRWIVLPHKSASNIKVGDVVGYIRPEDGYRIIVVGGRKYMAHRLIWLYVHGRWPASQIDHVNGDKSDNRLVNLREATNGQNKANSNIRRNNTLTGYTGVTVHGETGKYRVRAQFNGKMRSFGLYESLEKAVEVRRQAAREVFGEFARQK